MDLSRTEPRDQNAALFIWHGDWNTLIKRIGANRDPVSSPARWKQRIEVDSLRVDIGSRLVSRLTPVVAPDCIDPVVAVGNDRGHVLPTRGCRKHETASRPSRSRGARRSDSIEPDVR